MGKATAKTELFAQWKQGSLVVADEGQSTGARFWVKSTGTDSTGYGRAPDKPFASLDYASTQCTASAGDIIYVMAGHAETIIAATGCNLAVAGVRVVGLGAGANRPTYTFTTAAAATMTVDAANVTIENVVFVCSIDQQTAMLDVNADDCTVKHCEFRADATYQPLTFIDLTSAAANGADRLTVADCIILSPTAGATQGIELGEVNDGVTLRHNWIYGDFSGAGVHNPTGKILTRLLLENNYVTNLNAGNHAIELVSACTGNCVDNRLYGSTWAAILDPGSLFCNGNLAVDAIDQSGVGIPDTPAVAQFDSTDFAADAFNSTHFAAYTFTSDMFATDALITLALGDDVFNSSHFDTGAFDSTVFAAGAITAAAVADGAIDAATFAAGAINAAAVAGSAFTSGTFVDGWLDSTAFAANAFQSTTFQAGAINAAAIADASIDAATFAAGAFANAGFAANAFDSTKYTGDAATVFVRGKHVIKATMGLPQNGASTIFTVATGRVLLTGILGQMTTQAEAKANLTKLISTPTAGSAVDICGTTTINALETGGLLSITGILANGLVVANAGAVSMAPIGVVLAVGTLGVNCDTTATGGFKWDAWYLPLDYGATLA